MTSMGSLGPVSICVAHGCELILSEGQTTEQLLQRLGDQLDRQRQVNKSLNDDFETMKKKSKAAKDKMDNLRRTILETLFRTDRLHSQYGELLSIYLLEKRRIDVNRELHQLHILRPVSRLTQDSYIEKIRKYLENETQTRNRSKEHSHPEIELFNAVSDLRHYQMKEKQNYREVEIIKNRINKQLMDKEALKRKMITYDDLINTYNAVEKVRRQSIDEINMALNEVKMYTDCNTYLPKPDGKTSTVDLLKNMRRVFAFLCDQKTKQRIYLENMQKSTEKTEQERKEAEQRITIIDSEIRKAGSKISTLRKICSDLRQGYIQTVTRKSIIDDQIGNVEANIYFHQDQAERIEDIICHIKRECKRLKQIEKENIDETIYLKKIIDESERNQRRRRSYSKSNESHLSCQELSISLE